MDFKLIQNVVASLNNTVQQTVIVAVRNLKQNTYKTTVENLPDFPKDIRVNNQISLKKTENKLAKLVALITGWKFPKEIRVSNFPKFPEFPNFPKEIKISNPPVIPKFPDKIEISNPPTADLKKINNSLGLVEKAVKNLKLDPVVSVEAPKPERVIVPPAQVTVEKTEIDYTKLSKAIADKIPTFDYQKLADTLAAELASRIVSVGGGSGGSSSFRNTNGDPGRALIDQNNTAMAEEPPKMKRVFIDGSITYLCQATPNQPYDLSAAIWQVMKIDETDPEDIRISFAGGGLFNQIADDPTSLSYGA